MTKITRTAAGPRGAALLASLVALGLPISALAQYDIQDGLNLEWGGNTNNVELITAMSGDVNLKGVHTSVNTTTMVFQTLAGFTLNVGNLFGNSTFVASYGNGAPGTIPSGSSVNQPFYVAVVPVAGNGGNTNITKTIFIIDGPGNVAKTGEMTGDYVYNSSNFAYTGIFIGSFICDSAGAIIPFVRHGDEVTLSPFDSGGSGGGLGYDIEPSNGSARILGNGWQGNHSLPMGVVGTLTLAPAMLPITASGMILNISTNNTDSQEDILLVTQNTLTTTNTSTCSIHPQVSFLARTYPPNLWFPNVRLAQTSLVLNLMVCQMGPAPGAFGVTAVMHGYVEDVRHPE
jgi:hypothetical protein